MTIFKSKKFWMAVTGVIVVVIAEYMPGIDEESVTNIVYLFVAYLGGQGLADLGKEAKK